MYPYRMIAFHSNQVKSNYSICGNQDGHTNRSVQVKRYIWQVSLFLKIAIIISPINNLIVLQGPKQIMLGGQKNGQNQIP